MNAMNQLERDVRFLKRYAIVTTTLGVMGCVAAFRNAPADHERFKEISVERINVMEPDGKYRMVISNRPRSIGPIYKSKPFGRAGGDRPGIIFFNDEGTENGGLTFTGTKDSLGRVNAGTHMSFDQFNQDQVLNFDYSERRGRRLIGMSIHDRTDADIYDLVKELDSIRAIPDTAARNAATQRWATMPRNGQPLDAERVFVGRDYSKSAIVNLHDRNGRPRLRMLVDSLGAARIEFLDERGTVTRTIP
jgi:hypothetical protein